MNPAGVIRNHSADRIAIVSCGVGTEGEAEADCFTPQLVRNNSGLNFRPPFTRTQFLNVGHVFTEVENHGRVDRLAGNAGSAAAAYNRRVVTAADLQPMNNVFS